MSTSTTDRIARIARAAFAGDLDAADDAEAALETLRIEHADWARVDLSNVHPSWALRALRGESPAVQRIVAARAPAEIAEQLRSGLGLAPEDLKPDQRPHPIAVATALSLWSERLVGGPSARPNEPAVVEAVAGADRVGRRRLFHLIGLAKWAFASPEHPKAIRAADRARLEHFRAFWGATDPRLARLARLDLRAAGDPEPVPARLALITLGRLLGEVEPTRARWVLQHLPYDAAKWARLHGSLDNPIVSRRSLLAWERQVLAAARDRIDAEEPVDVDPGTFP